MKLQLKKADTQDEKAIVEENKEEKLKATPEDTQEEMTEENMEEIKNEEVVAVMKKEEKLSDYLRRITEKHASGLYKRVLDETVKAANDMEIEARIGLSDKEAKISGLVVERLKNEGLNVVVSENELSISWL